MKAVPRVFAAALSLGAAALSVVIASKHDATQPALSIRTSDSSACYPEAQQEPIHFVNCGGFF